MNEWHKQPGLWIVSYAGAHCWAMVDERNVTVFGRTGNLLYKNRRGLAARDMEPVRRPSLLEPSNA